ncbi:hypothetical protein [Levilactobacillus sp. 244-2]|uniref:hypothetical protein n=1 Tax=Levilactobacillus sp. 244-2 TaxID=2799569 RepID=UPI0019505E66|nr:hypothetical protein [Levilactobacillus sp. 244-2]
MTEQNSNGATKNKAEKPNLITDMAAAQETRFVDYKDENGDKKTREIKVMEPDIGPTAAILDLLNVGDDTADFGEVFDRVMNDVITEPRMSYGQMEKDLPDEYKKKTVNKKNKRGEDIKLHLVFPGFRKAIQIFMMIDRPSGASNITGTLKEIDAEIFRTADKQVVKEEYWNAGGYAYGLGMFAIGEAQDFLASALTYNGNLDALVKGLTFLKSSQLK